MAENVVKLVWQNTFISFQDKIGCWLINAVQSKGEAYQSAPPRLCVIFLDTVNKDNSTKTFFDYNTNYTIIQIKCRLL